MSFGFTGIDYAEVLTGTPINQIADKYGPPYAVRELGEGTFEYEYIERAVMYNQLIYENHYFLTVVGGKVVGKRMTQETAPPYDNLYQQDPNYPSYP